MGEGDWRGGGGVGGGEGGEGNCYVCTYVLYSSPHPLEVSEGSISFQLDDLLKASREETQP